MTSLETSYLGIPLRNPIIAGACSLTAQMDSIKQIEAAGAGALVIKSLFEEEIQLERFQFDEEKTKYEARNAEMISVTPNVEHGGPKEHLMWVKKAKQSVQIPVIASLNAVNHEVWLEYAKRLEETGVDAIECNLFSTPRDPELPSQTLEAGQIELVRELKKAVRIPVSVKLSPFYTNPLHVIHQMDAAGADGFVLFNRVFEPDIDVLEERSIAPFNLSHDNDCRLPLRYAGLLEGRVRADVCCSSGISTGEQVAKMLLAGAGAVQVVSALYRYKITHVRNMLNVLEKWMASKGYQRLADFRGKMSQRHSRDPWAYTRAHYVRLLMNPEKLLKTTPVP